MAAPDLTARGLDQLVSLSGRVALITGGARGIGAAVARRLVEAGANVYIGDRDGDGAMAVAEQLSGRGVKVLGGALDVTDSAGVTTTVDRVVAELGGLDILVNNAGIYPATPFVDGDAADWDRVLAVNLGGAVACSRASARRMVESGCGGVIVNITSVAAHKPGGPAVSSYCAAKHALSGLTKALALELGPNGIRVVSVAPGLIATPGIDETRPALEAAGLGDALDKMGGALPLGRMGQPDDVARVVLFCASDLAAFVSGSTVFVDGGGMTM